MRTRTTTLLLSAVLLGAQTTSHAAVIVDQSSGQTGNYIGSQDFPDQPTYSEFVFDDFTLSATTNLGAFTALGRDFFGSPSDNLSVVAGVYAAPDAATSPILSTTGTEIGVDLVFDFAGAALPAGTYWISAYVVRPNSEGGWYWRLRLPTGYQAVWHNPGGGFGLGTSPLSMGNVIEQADVAFILESDEPPPPASVGGTVTGVTVRKVVCRNRTTRKHVVIRDGAASWDCEASGLVVTASDTIRLDVKGKAGMPPPSAGGSVTGVTPTEVLCRARRSVTIADGLPSWNCEAAGLVVSIGNTVTQIITGTAN